MRLEALKTHEHVVDISKYTEMEIEHGHDTSSSIPKRHGVHVDFSLVENSTKQARGIMSDVRGKALSHTVLN